MSERVQSLSTYGLDNLPEQFIRPAHERPENTEPIQGICVPKISLAQPDDVLVDEISRASKEWGFFIVTEHGLSEDLISRLKEVGEEFFRLPQEEKERYANDPMSTGGKMEGYGTRMTKNLDQKLEWVDYYFHLLWPPSTVNYEFWPANPPSYRQVNEEYGKEVIKVADKILEHLSVGLGLDKGCLKKSLLNGSDAEQLQMEMKINLYPPCPQPHLALGVEPHTDMSALTVLVPNQVPGLQVWKDGNWVPVDYFPDALYIHVGDQIEVLSNGKFKSVLHRSVVNKKRLRMSWAVFCVPPPEAVIGPLPELLVSDQADPPKFNSKTYKEYQYRKFNMIPQ